MEVDTPDVVAGPQVNEEEQFFSQDVEMNNWNAPNNRFRGNRFGPGPPMRGGRGGNFGRGGGRGGQNNRFDGNWPPNSSGGPGPGPQNMNFGPPPHMNGPPGFPPPQMFQELWVETPTEDGKSYYYHAMSRETTWTRPEGPNIKIMTQSEVETMNKMQHKPMEHDPTKMPPGALMPPNLMDTPPQQHQAAPSFMPPFTTGPPPGQFGMPPPQWNPNPQWPQGQQPPDPTKLFGFNDKAVDPVILAKANEWTEHRAPDMRVYYYHAARSESVWERPQAMKDLDEARIVAAGAMQTPPPALLGIPPSVSTQGNVAFDSQGFVIKPETKQVIDLEAEKEKKRKEEQKRKEDAEKMKVLLAKPLDKSRPVSSIPISGTPWCVVWTGDSRVFFYNPSSRTSVWERPEDLVGRSDVDKAVNTIPDALIGSREIAPVVETKKPEPFQLEIEKAKSESSDEEESPPKKLKVDGVLTTSPTKDIKEVEAVVKPIPTVVPVMDKKSSSDLGKEAAIEAEVRAARERALVPLDIRVKSFKEMLREKEVSAFSTWEKELHKIVFDPRYLLLASRERKQIFEKYVKDRAEEERREKRNKIKQKKDDFRELMEQGHLHGKSSFNDFSQKHGRDDRFKGIEKVRERESLFNEFIVELRKREKDDRQQKKDQIKKDFFALLREQNDIDRHSRWMEIKKKIDTESRYKAVSDSVQREDYFYDFLKVLKDERKKAKESKEHKKDRKSDRKDKERHHKDKKKDRKDKNGGKDSDVTIVEDDKDESVKNDTKSEEKSGDEKSTTIDVKSDSEGEKSDGERSSNDGAASDGETQRKKEQDRQARAEASIKTREKEVQKTLAANLRDRDKERLQHQRGEAIRHFTALLADLVRNPDLSWKEVKKQLKKDHRYELVDSLEREERERIFNDHIGSLTKKKRDKFREMVDELPQIELTSSWKEIKKLIKDDPRYLKFNSSERCEREFREYIKDKTVAAKSNFRELLHECKFITHKSYEIYKENKNHLKEVEDILKMDKRYLVLEHLADERKDTILGFLVDLENRGAPPPPTASDNFPRRK